jgi:hypothetical protein
MHIQCDRCFGSTMETDELLFAKEQLQELKTQWQCLHDSRLALSLFLEDGGVQCPPSTDGEEHLLREQMVSLEV